MPAAETMPVYVREALNIALTIDPSAESMGFDAWDCLLVNVSHAPAVIEALGDRFDFEDPNDPPTPWTRVLVKAPAPHVGGSLPPVDLGYVRNHMPDAMRLAERYNAARARFIRARNSGAQADGLRRKAETLRDALAAKDPARR